MSQELTEPRQIAWILIHVSIMNRQLQKQLIVKNQLLITIPHQPMVKSKFFLPQITILAAWNFDKAFIKMEAKLLHWKFIYIDCKILILNITVDLFIESFKKNKIEKCENSNMELFQENNCFLQKELLTKNDIIKSMMETQTVALEAVVNLDEKPQDQQGLAN